MMIKMFQMTRSLFVAAALSVGSGAVVMAAEAPPPVGPVTLDERQLDAIAAGNGLGLALNAFRQAHSTLAQNIGLLPEPAIAVVLALHAPILNGSSP